MKKLILPLLAILTFTACKKDKIDIEEGTPTLAFESFLKEESQDANLYFVFDKTSEEWVGEFILNQEELLINKVTVNDDFVQNIQNKEWIKALSTSDMDYLTAGEQWNFNIKNTEGATEEMDLDIAKLLEVDIDLGARTYINPNEGLTIYFTSEVPEHPDSKSGEKVVVLYSKDKNYDMHAYKVLKVNRDAGSLYIAPEDFIDFQNLNDVEIHIFQKEVFDMELFDVKSTIQIVSKRKFFYQFFLG